MYDHRIQNTLPVSSLVTILRTLLCGGLSSSACSELYVTLYRLTRELIRCDRSPTAFLSILKSRTLPVLLSRNELRLSAAYDSKTGENCKNNNCSVNEMWQTREKIAQARNNIVHVLLITSSVKGFHWVPRLCTNPAFVPHNMYHF